VDGAPADAARADAGAGDGAARLGFVTLSSDQSPARARAVATFLEGGPAFLCSEQVSGACTLYRCMPRPGAGGAPAPTAGVIRITGTTAPLALTPAPDGFYEVMVLQSSLWMGGETITASAAGDRVPAFSDTLTTPGRITLTAPAVPAGDYRIDRGRDLALTWSGGAAEEVIVTIGLNTSDPFELECTFPAAGGAGTIPAAGLSLLPAGDGYYSALTRKRKRLSAGAWQVTLRADSNATLPDGRLVLGPAILN
jgi:hypothetical protein